MHEATQKITARPWAKAALFVLACGSGACSAVLDFTECRSDEDCAAFFVDNRPLFCNEAESRCKVKQPGCTTVDDCAMHSDNSICGLSSECFELQVGDGAPCDEPVYPSGEKSDVIYIGSILNSTASYNGGVEQAIQMAISDFNANATIADKKVAWIRCDSGGDVNQAIAAAEYLAGKEVDNDIVGVGVAGVIGPVEDAAFKGVAGVTLASGVNAFTISPGAVGPVPNDQLGLVYRANAGAERRAVAIRNRVEDLNLNTAYVLYGNEAAGDYAQSVLEAFEGNVVGSQQNILYNSQLPAADLVALLPKSNVPELLMIIGGDEIADILTEYVSQGLPIPTKIIVTERGASAVVQAVTSLGPSAQDLIDSLEVIAPAVPQMPATSEAFRQRLTGEFPGTQPGAFVELAYDSTALTLLAAASQSSTSGPNVAAGIQSIVTVDGVEAPLGTATDMRNAAQALLNGSINLTGVSSTLSVNPAIRDTCHDFVSYKVSGTTNPSLVPQLTMGVTCPDGAVGDWMPTS